MTGSIQVRVLKNGTKSYHAVWRAGGKQRRKAFKRKKDATRFLADTVTKVHDGSWQEVRPALMEDVFQKWLDHLDTRLNEGNIKPSTAGNYRSLVAKHLRPLLGDHRSNELTARTMDVWRRAMLDSGVSAKTFNNVLNLIGTILKWARQRNFLAHDPLAGQERRAVPDREAAILEKDDMEALLGAVADSREANAVVHLALFAGLRRGELFALQWKDVRWGDGLGGHGANGARERPDHHCHFGQGRKRQDGHGDQRGASSQSVARQEGGSGGRRPPVWRRLLASPGRAPVHHGECGPRAPPPRS